jgi:8-oxo-dGTP pyrophosphatase MutT (NUDIX family)
MDAGDRVLRRRAVTPEDTRNPWQTVSSKQVYENPWISVREDRVVRPDGEPGIYGVVHYKNTAVGVLAIEDDHVYLVGQYRYPLEMYSWEIPEGGCPEGEEPLSAARRELWEETGLRAARWRKLGEAYLSNSVADEYAVWFLATGLVSGEGRPEGTEKLSVRRVPLREARAMALDGTITDALSLVAITSYALKHPDGA